MSTKQQHTAGPWHVITYTGEPMRKEITANILGGEVVAVPSHEFTGATIETVEANACLIAAAPALLEALEAVATECDEACSETTLSYHVEKMVRAALSLARGES